MSKSFFCHTTSVIDEGAIIGSETKIWHYTHVMGKAQIGECCNIGQNVFIADHVVLGDNVKIQNNVSVYAGVECEDHVFLGPSMVFTNVLNPRSHVNRQSAYSKTLVKEGASIGANATVICGNTLGAYCLVGAGAVVTHDVADFAIVMGNPAKQAGWVSKHGEKLHFDKNGKAVCPATQEVYQIENGKVKQIGFE